MAPCGHTSIGWVRNPGFRYVLGVAELILPAAALVGDQAPPRWPRVRIPSLACATNRIGRRNLRNRKSLDPCAQRPRRMTGPLVVTGFGDDFTDARVC